MGLPKKVKCNISTFTAGEEVLWADVNAWNSCSRARHPLLSNHSRKQSPNHDKISCSHIAIWFTPSLCHRIYFSARFKKEKRMFFFLASHLSLAWLHKCVSVFPLMTSSITNKHLLIYQFCRQPSKWAERLLTSLRLLLHLILSNDTNKCTRGFEDCSSIICRLHNTALYFLATLAQ